MNPGSGVESEAAPDRFKARGRRVICDEDGRKIAAILPEVFGLLYLFPNWHESSCLESSPVPRAHGLLLVRDEIVSIRPAGMEHGLGTEIARASAVEFLLVDRVPSGRFLRAFASWR